ncbi:MAG: prepilin-type N-terminal cleavage/methylation domain-containing protein [bacterium]|nr:prepilin-type N-terminal cleavage/methylation domain-containing protein [bacterium]
MKNKNGFTLVEILVCIAIIAVMGIAIGVSTNKMSKNTKNTNNENLLKEILSAGNTYCQLSAKKSECIDGATVTFDNLISAGVLDEKILDKVNPTINGNVKFRANNFVSISIVGGERDIIYISESNIYKLSTIDNCTKNGDCSWGE